VMLLVIITWKNNHSQACGSPCRVN